MPTVFILYNFGENNWKIITAYKIAFTAANRQIWKLFSIAIRVISFQTFEEKCQKLFVFEARCEVLDSRII